MAWYTQAFNKVREKDPKKITKLILNAISKHGKIEETMVYPIKSECVRSTHLTQYTITPNNYPNTISKVTTAEIPEGIFEIRAGSGNKDAREELTDLLKQQLIPEGVTV